MSANDTPWDFVEKVPKRQNPKDMKKIYVVLPEKIGMKSQKIYGIINLYFR